MSKIFDPNTCITIYAELCQTKFTLNTCIVYPDSYPDGTYIQVKHGHDMFPAVVCRL